MHAPSKICRNALAPTRSEEGGVPLMEVHAGRSSGPPTPVKGPRHRNAESVLSSRPNFKQRHSERRG